MDTGLWDLSQLDLHGHEGIKSMGYLATTANMILKQCFRWITVHIYPFCHGLCFTIKFNPINSQLDKINMVSRVGNDGINTTKGQVIKCFWNIKTKLRKQVWDHPHLSEWIPESSHLFGINFGINYGIKCTQNIDSTIYGIICGTIWIITNWFIHVFFYFCLLCQGKYIYTFMD